MTDTFFHGVNITEPVTGVRPITTIATAVIGLIAVAEDADEDVFPLDTPVLITGVRTAIGSAGTSGTLAKALGAIADQTSPTIVVIRVAAGADAEETEANIIGGTAGGIYTGLQALLAAEAVTGVRPRVLGVPGYDSQAVATALVVVAKKLHAMVYAKARDCDDVSDALTYRQEFGDREIMLIWPDFSGWDGQAVAVALGKRAGLDETEGWQRSLSNSVVGGVTGIDKHVSWDLQDMDNDAGLLNAGEVTTLIRSNGYRFWGNRTCSDEPLFAFEVATRSAQILRDTIAQALRPWVDKPLTKGLIRDVIESINAKFRELVSLERIIGALAWYDAEINPPNQLAADKLRLRWKFTPCAPAEDIDGEQFITDEFYAAFAEGLSDIAG